MEMTAVDFEWISPDHLTHGQQEEKQMPLLHMRHIPNGFDPDISAACNGVDSASIYGLPPNDLCEALPRARPSHSYTEPREESFHVPQRIVGPIWQTEFCEFEFGKRHDSPTNMSCSSSSHTHSTTELSRGMIFDSETAGNALIHSYAWGVDAFTSLQPQQQTAVGYREPHLLPGPPLSTGGASDENSILRIPPAAALTNGIALDTLNVEVIGSEDAPFYGSDEEDVEDQQAAAVNSGGNGEDGEEEDDDVADADFTPRSQRVVGRRRRGSTNRGKRATGEQVRRTKISKHRTPARRSSSSLQRKLSGKQGNKREEDTKDFFRPFSCPALPYGCDTRFSSKNEWKRHVNSQHLTFGFWRCDLCPDQKESPNNFNRKDLFTQHLRRMHAPSRLEGVGGGGISRGKSRGKAPKSIPRSKDETFEKNLEVIRQRCWMESRKAPSKMQCAFCRREFGGAKVVDEWLEHCGQHMLGLAQSPSDEVAAQWSADATFRDWLLKYGLAKPDGQCRWRLTERSFAEECSPVVEFGGWEEDAEGDPA